MNTLTPTSLSELMETQLIVRGHVPSRENKGLLHLFTSHRGEAGRYIVSLPQNRVSLDFEALSARQEEQRAQLMGITMTWKEDPSFYHGWATANPVWLTIGSVRAPIPASSHGAMQLLAMAFGALCTHQAAEGTEVKLLPTFLDRFEALLREQNKGWRRATGSL